VAALHRLPPSWFEADADLAARVFLPLLAAAPRAATVLAAFAGLCAGALVLAGRPPPPWRGLAAQAALFAALVAWGAVSAAWAPQPLHTPASAARLAGLFAAALVLAAHSGSMPVAPPVTTAIPALSRERSALPNGGCNHKLYPSLPIC
jgi:hypothetical protein